MIQGLFKTSQTSSQSDHSNPGLLPSPCFPNFLARTTFVLVSLSEVKIPGQDAIFGDFVLNSSKMQEKEGKDKDEIVLLKQNEISSLIMEAATLKKYIWSCFGQTAPAGCE